MTDKTLGQQAYETFARKCWDKHVGWEKLSDREQDAWFTAAHACANDSVPGLTNIARQARRAVDAFDKTAKVNLGGLRRALEKVGF